MNIPNWAKWPLAAVGILSATAAVTNNVREHTASIIHLNGTPDQAEAAIRAKFPAIADKVVDSLRRRLSYIAQEHAGTVVSISGDFYVDERHDNSLFPEGFDHSQWIVVDVDGQTIRVDATSVPQDVTDNTRQKEGQ